MAVSSCSFMLWNIIWSQSGFYGNQIILKRCHKCCIYVWFCPRWKSWLTLLHTKSTVKIKSVRKLKSPEHREFRLRWEVLAAFCIFPVWSTYLKFTLFFFFFFPTFLHLLKCIALTNCFDQTGLRRLIPTQLLLHSWKQIFFTSCLTRYKSGKKKKRYSEMSCEDINVLLFFSVSQLI